MAQAKDADEREVMLHRRCDSNDNKGNGENLDETDHSSASTMLLLDPRAEAMDKVRRLSLQQNFPPTAIFAPAESVASYKAHVATSSSRLLEKALPPNVHLLSLDQRYGSGNATVLRAVPGLSDWPSEWYHATVCSTFSGGCPTGASPIADAATFVGNDACACCTAVAGLSRDADGVCVDPKAG